MIEFSSGSATDAYFSRDTAPSQITRASSAISVKRKVIK